MKTSSKLLIAAWAFVAAIGITNRVSAETRQEAQCRTEAVAASLISDHALNGRPMKCAIFAFCEPAPSDYWMGLKGQEYADIAFDVYTRIGGQRAFTQEHYAGGNYYSGFVNGTRYSGTTPRVYVGSTGDVAKNVDIKMSMLEAIRNDCMTKGPASKRYKK